jgi:uncharacterized protein (TIGR00645 family)
MKNLQDSLEKLLFGSRWFLAPMYLGLVIALLLLIGKFGQEFWHTIQHFGEFRPQALVIAVLELVDIVLVGNLLLMIIFSGYENFVSKIDAAEGHVDRPSWMGTIDYSGLKQKIIGSVVAISSIELLKLFIDLGFINFGNPTAALGEEAKKIMRWKMAWMVGLHGTFVGSGLLFALTEKIGHTTSHPPHAGGLQTTNTATISAHPAKPAAEGAHLA